MLFSPLKLCYDIPVKRKQPTEKQMEDLHMNTWYTVNPCSMAYLLAEDTGAPELRSAANSGIRVNRKNRHAVRPLRVLRSLITTAFGI